jgi:hypothetical protein
MKLNDGVSGNFSTAPSVSRHSFTMQQEDTFWVFKP